MKLWITSTNREEDAKHLESLGVVLGRNEDGTLKWIPDAHANKAHGVPGRGDFHDCEASPDALGKLDPFWMHRYIWGPEKGSDPFQTPNIHTRQVGPTLEPYDEEKAKQTPTHLPEEPDGTPE